MRSQSRSHGWRGGWHANSFSIAIPWLAWRLARQLLTPAAAALTAAFCAFSPLYITYGGYFTSEIPSLAFMVAALRIAAAATTKTGPNAAILTLMAGLMGGVAVAMRPQWLLNIVLVAAMLIFRFRRPLAPLATLALGVALLIVPVVAYTSAAAHRFVGLNENGGLTVWAGHCDVHDVSTRNAQGLDTTWLIPPAAQLNRGGSYDFVDRSPWDQAFFYRLAWDCIKRDGAHHLSLEFRNVIDMTSTTTPWPQVNNERHERDVVQVANMIYSVLLPWIVIESLLLVRRRRKLRQPLNEAILLAHLGCALMMAVLIFGDPRFRSVYDVFGFALLGALLAELLNLDQPEEGARDLEDPD